MTECSKLIKDAKERYLLNLGNKLNDPLIGPKKYWSIINKFLNKKRIPLIPPILHNNIFVTDIVTKANLFNDFFALQCNPFRNASFFYQILNIKLKKD